MAKSENQKMKLLLLKDYFEQYTDPKNLVSMEDIISFLSKNNILAERKAIYSDISVLKEYGLDIQTKKEGKKYYYFLAKRDFAPTEVSMIANAVASAKFLDEKKAQTLVKKITKLAGKRGEKVNQNVAVRGRVRTSNNEVMKNIQAIQRAMTKQTQISFDYMQWNENKEIVRRDDGIKTGISPWQLVWDNENYYLVAWDGNKKGTRFYRVDKMANIVPVEQKREGSEELENVDAATYSNQYFGMFHGETETVTLSCNISMVNVMLDHFGKDTTSVLPDVKKGRYRVRFKVVVSKNFLGWLLGLGDGFEIISPQSVKDQMTALCAAMIEKTSRREIKNLVFDIGSVLVDFRYRDYMKDKGFPEEIIDFFDGNIVLSPLWLTLDSAENTQSQVIEKWKEQYPDMAKWIELFFTDAKEMVAPYADTYEWLSSYKKMGYRIFLLTNYPDELFDLHKEHTFSFMDLVDGYIVSAKVKACKPQDEIYDTLFRTYQLKANECVFLDDREENVKGADRNGMYGISCKDRAKGKADLERFLAYNGYFHENADK